MRSPLGRAGRNLSSCRCFRLEPPAFVSTVSRVSAPVDAVALLPCNAVGTPSPDYEWTTSDGDLQTSTFSNGTLRIANVQRSDAGFYRCRASNEGGFIQTTVELDVQCTNISGGVYLNI